VHAGRRIFGAFVAIGTGRRHAAFGIGDIGVGLLSDQAEIADVNGFRRIA